MPPPTKNHHSEKHFIGVDPGFTGAFAVINNFGRIVTVHDMPLADLSAVGRRVQYDRDGIQRLAHRLAMLPGAAVSLEYPNAHGHEAANAMQRFGVGLGYVEMACHAAGLPIVKLAPNLWKGQLGLAGVEKDKEAKKHAVELARRYFPDAGDLLKFHSKHHGRAEALLIAFWTWTRTINGLRALVDRWGKHSVMAHAFLLAPGSGRRRRRGDGKGF